MNGLLPFLPLFRGLIPRGVWKWKGKGEKGGKRGDASGEIATPSFAYSLPPEGVRKKHLLATLVCTYYILRMFGE